MSTILHAAPTVITVGGIAFAFVSAMTYNIYTSSLKPIFAGLIIAAVGLGTFVAQHADREGEAPPTPPSSAKQEVKVLRAENQALQQRVEELNSKLQDRGIKIYLENTR